MQANKASIAFSSLWLHLESMASLLGSRPVELSNDYQTPLAWGSIGQTAAMIDQLKENSVSQGTIKTMLEGSKADVEIHTNEKISTLQSTLIRHLWWSLAPS